MVAGENRNPSTRVLERGEIVSVDAAGWECRISCMAGRLWVTVTGQETDTVLEPGQEAAWTASGRIVVEALRTATVRVEVTAPARGRTVLLAAQPAR